MRKLVNSNGDKLKNSNCDKTQKLKLCQNLKLWWNSNCDETQDLKKWRKKLKCEEKNTNSKFDKTQIVTKIENLNCDKTQ